MSSKIVYVDNVIERLGKFGPWQLIIFSQCLLMQLFYGAISMVFVFMEFIPDHVCQEPAGVLFRETNWTYDQIVSISTPKDNHNNYDYCKYYSGFNYSELATQNYQQAYQQVNSSLGNITTDCNHWWFKDDTMRNTMVTQWGLVCGQAIEVANAQLLYQAGFVVAALVAGLLADRFGRLRICIIFNVITACLGTADALMPNFIGFLCIRIMLSTCATIASTSAYILCLEYCPNGLRQLMGAAIFLPWYIATDVWAGLAYWLMDWRYIHILAAAPLAISVLCIWTLPESPRWLVAENKQKEALKVLRFAVKINNADIPELTENDDVELRLMKEDDVDVEIDSLSSNSSSMSDSNPPQITMLQLLRVPKLCLRVVVLSYIWFGCSLVFTGVVYIVSSFSGNLFVNNAITGVIQVPSCLLTLLLLHWGRKKGQIITFLVAGAALILYLPIPAHLNWLRETFAMIGNFAITASFNIIFIFTSELFPTAIRGTALNISATFGRIGGMVAPYLNLIAQKNEKLLPIPMVIFGVFAFTCGLSGFLLPETVGHDLPETLEDCINYPPTKNNEKYKRTRQKSSRISISTATTRTGSIPSLSVISGIEIESISNRH